VQEVDFGILVGRVKTVNGLVEKGGDKTLRIDREKRAGVLLAEAGGTKELNWQ